MAANTRFLCETSQRQVNNWIFLNDAMVRGKDAVLHIRDLSIQRGYGIFDFVKIVEDRPVFIDDHLQRFYASAEQMRLPVPYNRGQIKNIIADLLKANESSQTGIRLTLTGGYSADAYQVSKPNFIIETRPYSEPAAEQLAQGIHLITYEHQRQLPQVKSIDYLMAIWLQDRVRQYGADDVLYHQGGWITECPRSNFFIVQHDDTVITPSHNILKGVVRKNLLQWAPGKFKILEKDLSLQDVKQAKEAFITSTTKTIVPVSRIDNHIFPGDRRSTNRLRQEMLRMIATHG